MDDCNPHPGLPADLEPHEQGLAAWMAHLERRLPPARLREDLTRRAATAAWVLPVGAGAAAFTSAAVPAGAPPPVPSVQARLRWFIPFAAAACVLVAVGMLTLAQSARRLGSPSQERGGVGARGLALGRLEVVEDPTVPLFAGWDLAVAELAAADPGEGD
jgi:hypothetical protein